MIVWLESSEPRPTVDQTDQTTRSHETSLKGPPLRGCHVEELVARIIYRLLVRMVGRMHGWGPRAGEPALYCFLCGLY